MSAAQDIPLLGTADLPITAAWFDTAKPKGPVAIGLPERKTWQEVAEILTSSRREGGKDGPGFVPATFTTEANGRHVRRVTANVLTRTAIALDIETDEKTGEVPPPMCEAMARVRAQGWAAAAYTSHSHQPGAPRYRIVMPLSAEIAATLPSVELIAATLDLSGVLDASKVGPASFFYLPSTPPDQAEHHEATVVEGAPICAAWLEDQAGAVLAARETEQGQHRAVALAAAVRRQEDRIRQGFGPSEQIIEKVRNRLDLVGELLRHGYRQSGQKFLFKDSKTGVPGVHILCGSDGVERVYSHHSGDPLAAGNLPAWCSVKAIDVVDVVTILDHAGDRKAALRTLAARFGIEGNRPATRTEGQKPGTKRKDAPELVPMEDPAPEAEEKPKRQRPKRTEAAEHDPSKPVVRVVAGELHNTATEGEDAVIAAGLPIYQRGSALVRPVVQDVPASRGRMTVSAALHEIGAHGLTDALCSCASWERFDGRAQDWVNINPPRNVADTILSRVGMWRVPRVVGVITTPTIRPDGSILSAPGYDAETRLYHAADPAVVLSDIVKQPTREVAMKALALLQGLLNEFPFVDDTAVAGEKFNRSTSRSVALSGLITPVVRGALSVAPLTVYRASTAGTGKSYLVDIASAISSGRPCPVVAAGADEAETEKRLTGLLLAGFPIASLDNVNGDLGGDLLCQAIERPFIRLRPLGRSDIMEIESRATLYATGNGLRVLGDMVRRTLVADLDAGLERPELREFKEDPVSVIVADRGRYVSACLAIVRAYILAGRPGVLPPIASFSDWSNTVRSALVWLGCADPADSMEAAREDDPELAELREIIAVWKEAMPIGQGMTCKQIIEWSDGRQQDEDVHAAGDWAWPDLRDMLMRVAGDRGSPNTGRLGAKFRKHEGRIVGGYRIKRDTSIASPVAIWKLEAVKLK